MASFAPMTSVRTLVTSSFALSLAIWLAAPHDARACGQEATEVEILLPSEAGEPMSRDGTLVALVTAPDGAETAISLVTAAGAPVRTASSVQYLPKLGVALVRARSEEPLEAETEYVWSVGGLQRTFTTGDDFDRLSPVPGMPEWTLVGIGTGLGCDAETPWHEFALTVPGLDEAIVTLARGESLYAAASGSTVNVRLADDATERCFDLEVEDAGGHVVAAGTMCLPEAEAADDGSALPDGDPADDDFEDGGCGCKVRSHAGGYPLLCLLLLGAPAFSRRRSSRLRRG